MKKHQAIERVCAYCEHLTYTCPQKKANDKKYTAPYLAYLDVIADTEQAVALSCPYKKEVSPGGHCLHFRYDPLKRCPAGLRDRPTLDPDLVLTPEP